MNQMKWVPYAIMFCVTSASIAGDVIPKIIFVDASAQGANNGLTWADAYTQLQDALTDANDAGRPVEIRVAQGVYRPDQGMRQTPGDRNATFQLLSGVTLKGGYAGTSASAPNARDLKVYRTTLSGDLKGDDAPAKTGSDPYLWRWYLWTPASGRMENSYHVVTATGIDASAILDGFTVSSGNDDRSELGIREAVPIGYGGGMLSIGGHPMLVDCTFSSNAAGKGAAIYADQADLIVSNCTFTSNHAYRGGGLYACNGSVTFTDCLFTINSAHAGGGGLYSDKSSIMMDHCVFKRNDTLTGWGGAISNQSQSTSVISNCLFSGNRANFGGGGLQL